MQQLRCARQDFCFMFVGAYFWFQTELNLKQEMKNCSQSSFRNPMPTRNFCDEHKFQNRHLLSTKNSLTITIFITTLHIYKKNKHATFSPWTELTNEIEIFCFGKFLAAFEWLNLLNGFGWEKKGAWRGWQCRSTSEM